jgi:hypothetical protein
MFWIFVALMAMSLETPIKIRMLQRKLYQKAKEEPDYAAASIPGVNPSLWRHCHNNYRTAGLPRVGVRIDVRTSDQNFNFEEKIHVKSTQLQRFAACRHGADLNSATCRAAHDQP